jgi:hypothetical protein
LNPSLYRVHAAGGAPLAQRIAASTAIHPANKTQQKDTTSTEHQTSSVRDVKAFTVASQPVGLALDNGSQRAREVPVKRRHCKRNEQSGEEPAESKSLSEWQMRQQQRLRLGHTRVRRTTGDLHTNATTKRSDL